MAKKRKSLEPDADGYLNTGIFRRRVVKPTPTCDEKAAVWESLGKPQPTVREWLQEYYSRLADSVRPHVFATTLVEVEELELGGTLYPLDLGDGSKPYLLKGDLPTETREAVLDWINAIHQIGVLEHNIGPDEALTGSLRFVVNAAWNLGRLKERSGVRQCEPLAMIGRERVAHAAEMRNAKTEADAAKRIEKRRLAEEAMSWAQHNFPTAAHDDHVTFLKDRAAERRGISRDSLDRHLGYSD